MYAANALMIYGNHILPLLLLPQVIAAERVVDM